MLGPWKKLLHPKTFIDTPWIRSNSGPIIWALQGLYHTGSFKGQLRGSFQSLVFNFCPEHVVCGSSVVLAGFPRVSRHPGGTKEESFNFESSRFPRVYFDVHGSIWLHGLAYHRFVV